MIYEEDVADPLLCSSFNLGYSDTTECLLSGDKLDHQFLNA